MTPAELSEATAPAAVRTDRADLRERLANQHGPTYWRTLEEAMGTVELNEFVHEEFPGTASALLDPVSRRNFFKVMGASMMLAGLASCARQPEEQIVPYVKQPENMVPGKPQYYATAMTMQGYGMGLLATAFEGRPTKLEGLPEHPSSLGSTDIFAQATILDMYDPNRLDTVLRSGVISTWARFETEMATRLLDLDTASGAGLRILTGTVTSPTFRHQINRLLQRYPEARWHQFEPANRDNVRAGAMQAFGRPLDTIYDFSRARVVLSLDSDIFCSGVGAVRYSRDFANTRDVDATDGEMSRLYAAEVTPTLTGANADHKLALRQAQLETLAHAVAQRLGVAGVGEVDASGLPEEWINAVVEDLRAAAASGVVIAGDYQPVEMHVLAHAINSAIGSTIATHIEPVEVAPVDQMADLRALTEDMNAGNVSLLLILGGNPVYDTPADLNFAAAVEHVSTRVHLTLAANETSNYCQWVLPEAHFLEAWSDVRAHDGTISVVQPLILPLYGGKSCHELLAILLDEAGMTGRDIVRAALQARYGTDGFDNLWRTALTTGMIPESASAPVEASFSGEIPAAPVPATTSGLDVVIRPDATVFDGRFAANGWLQELPKPLTKLTWDNAVFIHPTTARALELENEDLVELSVGGLSVVAPVMVQFGHPRDAVTVTLGYGRQFAGPVGTERGYNAYLVQNSSSPWFASGAHLKKLGKKYQLVHTYEHFNIEQTTIEQGEKAEDRHLIREGTLSDWVHARDFAQHMGHPVPAEDFTLYYPIEKPFQSWEENVPPQDLPGENPPPSKYQWGMSIDLSRCNGCSVCTIACQAENNIPVVGKDQVLNGREMHWIRVDRYYKGDFYGEVQAVHQPVTCMQCENAPCEPVCPVGATVHSNEGLNDMVYNRCVGTRYCSNNCPYKVRRFNFFHWHLELGQDAPSLKMMRNPNVTVRSRGVMEKCTYCVQRINVARINAKVRAAKAGQPEDDFIRDGEVVVACQAACPTRAIQFGNLRDRDAQVVKAKSSGRNYGMIADIGTRPRTTYLARIVNPNPELGPTTLMHGPTHGGEHGAGHTGTESAPQGDSQGDAIEDATATPAAAGHTESHNAEDFNRH